VIDEILRRARSVRRFDASRPIPETVLRKLVNEARLAPCGGNQQALRYRLVSSSDECDTIFPFLAWAAALKDWSGPDVGQRPTGYIVILGAEGGDIDVGIAAQSIHLMAAEQGYGSCMLGSVNRLAIKSVLHLPDSLTLKLVIALGVSAEEVVIDDVHAGDSLKYYRTEDDKHHVPKLGLDDVLVWKVDS